MLEAGAAILLSTLSILLIFNILQQSLYWEGEAINRLEALNLRTKNKKFKIELKKISLISTNIQNLKYPKSSFLKKKIIWQDINHQEKFIELVFYEE